MTYAFQKSRQLVRSFFQNPFIFPPDRFTGPVLTEATMASNAVRIGFESWTSQGLALKDVANCTTCCKGTSPFEVRNAREEHTERRKRAGWKETEDRTEREQGNAKARNQDRKRERHERRGRVQARESRQTASHFFD